MTAAQMYYTYLRYRWTCQMVCIGFGQWITMRDYVDDKRSIKA